jgi:DNA-binding response OmpR family regulator
MKPHILVIEDEPALLSLIEQLLTCAGYAVSSAEHGRAAMKILNDSVVHLVVTDLVMPEQDGIETIRKIRNLQPSVPIIAMSGGGVIEADRYLKIARALGAKRLLPKPFATNMLVEMVRELVGAPE